MLNAIRIILGLIMAFIAFASVFAIAIFSQAYKDQAADNGLVDIILTGVILTVPFVSAWLLLFPKTIKHTYLGLAVGALFLAFSYSSQYL